MTRSAPFSSLDLIRTLVCVTLSFFTAFTKVRYWSSLDVSLVLRLNTFETSCKSVQFSTIF